MSAGPVQVFGAAIERIADGTYTLESDTLKWILLDENYSPDTATDTDLADISADEIDVGDQADYTRVTATGVTVSRTGTTVKIDCGDPSWGSSVSLRAKWAALFNDTHASDGLVCVVDLNTAASDAVLESTNSDFGLTIHANGLFQIAPAA